MPYTATSAGRVYHEEPGHGRSDPGATVVDAFLDLAVPFIESVLVR